MDSAVFYVAVLLGDLLFHPIRYGALSVCGVLAFFAIGFCIQFFGVSRLSIWMFRILPAAFCVLLAVFAELIWNGVLSIPGADAGFMSGNRMLAFAMCFLAIPMFVGILCGALSAFMEKRKGI